MNKINTEYFTIQYGESDENLISQITSIVDETYENIINQFRLNKDAGRFDIIICPDVQIFKKETGKSDEEYQEWMVGNADYSNRKLCILSPNVVRDRSFEDMLSVIRHEVIHIAFGQLKSGEEADIMIAEGIAIAYANQINIQALNEENYPDVCKLSDEQYFYENNGYLYAGVYVLHLLNKCGIEVFKKIYEGKESIEKYLYDGFEKDSIQSLKPMI